MSEEEDRPIRDIQQRVAGARLLDREIPADYLEERTSHVAAQRSQIAVGTKSVVIFRVANEWFALPTRVFQEIDNCGAAHTVPHHRNGILNGLVNVRGELVLSISLAALLQLEKTAKTAQGETLATRGRVLICGWQGSRFAFPVSEVHGVHRYVSADLRDVPATLAKAVAGTFVIGVLPWQNKAVGCLDDDLLFYAMDKRVS